MRAALFTREYPPNVYGGAGVHVDYLSRELAKKIAVEVHCWGKQDFERNNLRVVGQEPWNEISEGTQERFKAALEALSLNLTQVKALAGIDIAHTHTWYVSMAGFLAKKLYGVPFVLGPGVGHMRGRFHGARPMPVGRPPSFHGGFQGALENSGFRGHGGGWRR